jgi:hypothetical protein
MTIITDNLLNDTLKLVQLARETAQIRGQTKQADLLTPVADNLQTLATSPKQVKTTNPVPSSSKADASSEILAQGDFKTLLSIVQNNGTTASNPVNNIFSSSSNDRNRVISAMADGGMSVLDISRQMGMTRDEVQMYISLTNPTQNSALGTEE